MTQGRFTITVLLGLVSMTGIHATPQPGAPTSCPAHADIVVADEYALAAAVTNAAPGDVIAVDGMIELTPAVFASDFFGGLQVTVPLTLTCATPGSGLRIRPPMHSIGIAFAPTTIDRLVLDASEVRELPNAAFQFQSASATAINHGSALQNSLILCPSLACAFYANAPGALVLNNAFVSSSDGTVMGVRLQQDFYADLDSRIESNLFTASVRASAQLGIDGAVSGLNIGAASKGLTVSQNTIEGPWYYAIRLGTRRVWLTPYREAQLQFNHSEGQETGFWLADLSYGVVRNNVIHPESTGLTTGVALRDGSCGNVLVGNSVQAGSDIGLWLEVLTGDNTVTGSGSDAQTWNRGFWDCDGDGTIDPNILSGSDAVRTGDVPGDLVSDAMSSHGTAYVTDLAVSSDVAADGYVARLTWVDSRAAALDAARVATTDTPVVPELDFTYVDPQSGETVVSDLTVVDIYRDGAFLTTTDNDGQYDDLLGAEPPGTVSYQVCESSTRRCTAAQPVVF